MEKKFLQVYLLFFCISLSLLLFDGFADVKLGNKCYSLFSADFHNFFSKFLKSNDLKEENERLLEKIATLSYEKQIYNELKKENQELKEIIRFKFNYPKGIIPAEIERRTLEEINLSYQIDKGTSEGIERNAPVIGFKGIVGKVLKTGNNTSVIQTLKNYNSAISVKDTRSGIEGILKWNKKFFIEGVPQYADLRKGDSLLTSGRGSVFPKGLPVGIVTYVNKKMGDYLLEIEVEPFEDLTRIDVVFVIEK
ncbi:rod shape-determining protein MreC [candidate division WOR-3 bacterium]|nr:rod shape-determining protein MreC [candidate division WOR-3 bacterium]